MTHPDIFDTFLAVVVDRNMDWQIFSVVENLSVQTGLHHEFPRAKHKSLLGRRGGAPLLHVQRGVLGLPIIGICKYWKYSNIYTFLIPIDTVVPFFPTKSSAFSAKWTRTS